MKQASGEAKEEVEKAKRMKRERVCLLTDCTLQLFHLSIVAFCGTRTQCSVLFILLFSSFAWIKVFLLRSHFCSFFLFCIEL